MVKNFALSFSTNQKQNQNRSHLVQFSRALSKVHVIAREADWLIALFAPSVIGQGKYRGFGFRQSPHYCKLLNYKACINESVQVALCNAGKLIFFFFQLSKLPTTPPQVFSLLPLSSCANACDNNGRQLQSGCRAGKINFLCVFPDERSNQLLVLRTQHQGWREQSSTERLVSKERHYSILQEAAGLVFEDRRSDMRQSRGSAPDDMEVAADIMADLQHAQEIESQMLLGLHSKVRGSFRNDDINDMIVCLRKLIVLHVQRQHHKSLM